MELVAAIDALENALEKFYQIHYQLIDPQEVADVLLYLGLSYLEIGNRPSDVTRAFQQMILIAPERRLRPGYYPEAVVETYRDALGALIAEIARRPLPLSLPTQPEQLAPPRSASTRSSTGSSSPRQEARGARALCRGSSKEGAASGDVAYTDEAELVTIDAPTLREAGSRMMNRYADCLHLPTERELPGAVATTPIAAVEP